MQRKTLSDLLIDLRVRVGLSLQAAQNVQTRDHHAGLLRSEQDRLWDQHDWPQLRVERTFAIEAGQYLYDPPADLDIERIEKFEFKDGGIWSTVAAGIDAAHYAAHDSKLDQRSWPVRRWRMIEIEGVDKLEIWPVPDKDPVTATEEGFVKLTGIRKLNRLVEDTDRCDLDAQMLVLYVAAQLLAAQKAPMASTVANLAEQRRATLLSRATPRQRWRIAAGDETPVRRRRMISHYVPAT